MMLNDFPSYLRRYNTSDTNSSYFLRSTFCLGNRDWLHRSQTCIASSHRQPPASSPLLLPIGHLFLVMKILEENAGNLTNLEVLDFLRSKGAAKDPTKVLAPLKPSEFKVHEYLEKSSACTQTRESITDLCKPYKLTKSDITSIINIKPSSSETIFPIFEDRYSHIADNEDELIALIEHAFPSSKVDE